MLPVIFMNKSFVIDYANYSAYNGKYLLLYKKEIINQAGEAYDTTSIIGLQRIAQQDEEELE